MLHLRRSLLQRTAGLLGFSLAALAERLADSDPGLLRWQLALRGTASTVLMVLIAIGLSRPLGLPPTDLASGVVLSLIAPFWMREPNQRERERTLALITLTAAAAVAAAALTDGYHPAGYAGFLAVVFAGVLWQGYSTRAIPVGVVAAIVTYVSLYLQLPIRTLPAQLLSIVIAVPVIWFCAFVLVPVRPAATLRRTVHAVEGRAAAVLQAAQSLRTGNPAALRTLRRRLARLNEVALAADDLLAHLYPMRSVPLRFHLMDLELATARLAITPLGDGTGEPAAQRSELRQNAHLQLYGRRLRHGRWRDWHMLDAAPVPQPTSPPNSPAMPPFAAEAVFAGIARAAAALGQAAAALPVAAKPQRVPAAPPAPLAWRLAFRVTLAAALAMAGGMALSPQRWFWAVISSYVVFIGTRSRGETIFKGVQRLGGTLLGLVAGLTLATLLQGDGPAQAAVLLAAVFGMYYVFFVSYTAGIFCVTVLLGLLYSLLGSSMEPILLLRLEETAIGASAAVFVAVCVLPLRTRERVTQSGRAVLQTLADAVGECRRMLAGEPGAQPVPAMRKVDRQVTDLRLALLPLTTGRLLLRRSDVERPVPALLDCVHWARMLALAATTPDPPAAARAGAIEQCLRSLAEGQPVQAKPRADAIAGATGSSAVTESLDGLDLARAALVERLAIGALHAYQLEG